MTHLHPWFDTLASFDMDMNGLRPRHGLRPRSANVIHNRDIEALKKQVESEPTDWMLKLRLAEMLHRQGQVEEARILYQEIITADPGSVYTVPLRSKLRNRSANAINPLAGSDTSQPVHHEAWTTPVNYSDLSVDVSNSKKSKIIATVQTKLKHWLNHQSIRRKQLILFFLLEGITLTSLIGLNGWFIFWRWHQENHHLVRSELAVTELAYQLKIDQMLVSLPLIADNSAIVEAARGKLTPAVRAQVKTDLIEGSRILEIEYLTLIGKDFKIIVNANASRQSEIFNPNQLVSRVFQTLQLLYTTEVATWPEIQRENPQLPPEFKNQDALIRYVATPVKDPVTQEVIGVLLGGDIVNHKSSVFAPIEKLEFQAGVSAIFLIKNNQEFQLINVSRPSNSDNLEKEPQFKTAFFNQVVAAKGEKISQHQKLGSTHYQIAAQSILNRVGEPVGVIVRGVPETFNTSLFFPYLGIQLILSVILLILTGWLAWYFSQLITQPIHHLRESIQRVDGEEFTEIPKVYQDEIAQLNVILQEWIQATTHKIQALETQMDRYREEAIFHEREKEWLQQGMNQLLRDLEGIQTGNLMVRVPMNEEAPEEMQRYHQAGGSASLQELAGAINATVESLQELVINVQGSASELHQSACKTKTSVQTLTQEANNQSLAIAAALSSVADMGRSMQLIASSTLKAAVVSRQGLVAFKDGNKIMNQTVHSIEEVRNSVTEASVKVQRLAHSSQEISKILNLISGISEKTNLVAFNASIVAARASENGKVFRVVADEVQRLADRVTESTQEVEQLVTTIQQDTTQVLETMENSSVQVEAGTAMVIKTQQMLRKLAAISHNINQLLQSISTSTVSQAQSSQRVNQTMQSAAAIAQVTSAESELVAKTLQELVAVAEHLQSSVSRFQQ